jgi:hypothetical protein
MLDISDYVFKSSRLFNERLCPEARSQRGETLSKLSYTTRGAGCVTQREEDDHDGSSDRYGE